ncbi:MAG: hypothetical protein ACKOPB_04835, partial [Actinomycetota bacterium]
ARGDARWESDPVVLRGSTGRFVSTTTTLQRLTLPTPTTPEPLLYARTRGDARVVPDGIVLQAGAEVSFDTSFGVFHVGRWRRLTSVDALAVSVRA